MRAGDHVLPPVRDADARRPAAGHLPCGRHRRCGQPGKASSRALSDGRADSAPRPRTASRSRTPTPGPVPPRRPEPPCWWCPNHVPVLPGERRRFRDSLSGLAAGDLRALVPGATDRQECVFPLNSSVLLEYGSPMGDLIVGYAPGAYDLFHVGHLNVLRQAAAHCDVLVAGVVADEVLERDQGGAAVRAARGAPGDRGRIDVVDAGARRDDRADKVDAWRAVGFHRVFKGDDWRGTEKGVALETGLRARRRRGRLLPLHDAQVQHPSAPGARRAGRGRGRDPVRPVTSAPTRPPRSGSTRVPVPADAGVVTVSFDGRRVWSLRPDLDGERVAGGLVRAVATRPGVVPARAPPGSGWRASATASTYADEELGVDGAAGARARRPTAAATRSS